MKKINGLALLFREAALFFRPIHETQGEMDAVLEFFKGIGYDLDKALTIPGGDATRVHELALAIFGAVVKVVEELKKYWPEAVEIITSIDFPGDLNEAKIEMKEIESNFDGLMEWYKSALEPTIKIILDKQEDLVNYCKNLKSAADNQEIREALGDLPLVSLNALTYIYLRSKHPALFPTLEFLTIARWEKQESLKLNPNAEDVIITTGVVPKFDLQKLGDLFSRPGEVIKKGYWESGFPSETDGIARLNEVALNFFGRIDAILKAFGAHTALGVSDFTPDELEGLTIPERLKGMFSIYFPFYDYASSIEDSEENQLSKVGASFGLLESGATQNGPGVFVYPFFDYFFDYETRRWIYSLGGEVDPAGFKINKDGFAWLSSPAEPKVSADFAIEPAPGQNKLFVFGAETRLEIGSPSLKAGFKLADGNQPNLNASIVFADNKIVLATPEGDGFLAKILPEKGMEIPFGLGLGWSSQKGFYFTGSAGLEVTLTPKLTLFDALRFDWIRVSLRADESALSASAKLKISLNVSKFKATVGGMGLQYRWNYPKDGNPGKTEIKFLMPNMVGLILDTSLIAGGGYLSVEDGRYEGILQLTFKNKISFTAITIIDTKVPLPNGKKGFAMILIVCVILPKEIPIAMGFSLAGAGGLLALNRGMDIDVIRRGVYDKSFDSILFPKDPVANAEAIIRDIDQAFPIRLKNFVFGPTAIITWGTGKALLRIKLGLFFEIKEGKLTNIAVPGILTCILPKEEGEQQLIALRVNFLGLLSFEQKEFSFEACIFDSKIGTFALSGELLARLTWKGKANFLVSAGGFHPRYTPPPGVRQLRRMQLSLLDTEDAKILLQSYIAVTSNSVQLGARMDLVLQKSGLKIVGYIGFDTLVYFKPFRFFVHIYACFTVTQKGEELIAIIADVYLEGPAPWYFVGKATFKILGLEFSINVEKRTGQTAVVEGSLPDIHVLEWLIAELQKPEAWQAISTLSSGEIFKIKQPEDARIMVIPPESRICISQQQVPLGMHIEKIGLAKPTTAGKLKINQVRCGRNPLKIDGTLKPTEPFARGQFMNMGDAEKISSPAFEDFESGVFAESIYECTMSNHYVQATEIMEAIVLDGDGRTIVSRPGGLLNSLEIRALLRNGATGASMFSQKRAATRAAATGGPIIGARKNSSAV